MYIHHCASLLPQPNICEQDLSLPEQSSWESKWSAIVMDLPESKKKLEWKVLLETYAPAY